MVTMLYAQPARGICVMEVAGDFDEEAAGALRTRLVDTLGTRGPRLVLDLRAVRVYDVAGMQAIGEAATRAARRGGWVRVVAEQGFAPNLSKVFADVPAAVSAR